MPRFTANLSTLFQEIPLEQRFKAAAKAGFKGVEYLFPYDCDRNLFADLLAEANLPLILMNAPCGNWDHQQRGLACQPDCIERFQTSIGQAIEYASTVGCTNIHVMSGINPENVAKEVVLSTYADNLLFAAKAGDDAGIKILIEPINPIDMPGYLLNSTVMARAIMGVVNHHNLFLQLDLYHTLMNSENVFDAVNSNLDKIAHMQMASVPGRHEPNIGNFNYTLIFEHLDMIGYNGWIGCEYQPLKSTLQGLGWASIYGIGDRFISVTS